MAKVNKEWFRERLTAAGESQASLARHLGVDASNVSQLLNGRRRMHTETAEKIAGFLRVDVQEVLQNMGLKVRLHRPAPMFRLMGTVNAQMVMTSGGVGQVEGNDSMPADTVAARIQTAGTSADWMDGWLLFFQPSRSMDPSLMTRLCVAELSDGSHRVGNLRRGYAEGTFNIQIGSEMLENVVVTSATPVLWVKP